MNELKIFSLTKNWRKDLTISLYGFEQQSTLKLKSPSYEGKFGWKIDLERVGYSRTYCNDFHHNIFVWINFFLQMRIWKEQLWFGYHKPPKFGIFAVDWCSLCNTLQKVHQSRTTRWLKH